MNINFQAFKWRCNCSALPMEKFLAENALLNGINLNNRILYYIEGDDFWRGLVLTVKNMKKFTKIVNSSGKIRLDIHKLEKNEHIADFNFFIIDKNTGCGMYQHYHNSCSLNIFNAINKDRYLKIKNKLYEDAKIQLENENKPLKQIKNDLKIFNETIECSIIERNGSFVERVALMKSAKEAEIEFEILDTTKDEFVAIMPHMRRLKYQLFFNKESPMNLLIEGLTRTFKGAKLKKAKVVGIDEHGNDAVYKLLNDFDRFGSFDYEAMVPALSLDQDKVKESINENLIISKLIEAYNRVKTILVC
ncbi:hypothetical protein [Desulfovibrio legallii]|uniref:Uncharacterized protein n=1 Tax=Desulfovibrio legallii TaxID=571438 RepID=A0A6H3F7S9_9BACT|nr:hypothetical protein [Desulfovibrio legallii]TBH79058.1 hypothetical protein EB812_08625 [Desulfovibrio legallii]